MEDSTKKFPVFAHLLRRLSQKAGLKQVTIAKKWDLEPSAVSHWFSGRGRPGPDKLSGLAQLLNVPVETLIVALETEPATGHESSLMESSPDDTIVGVHPVPPAHGGRLVLHYRDLSVELPIFDRAVPQHVAIQTALHDLQTQVASRELNLAVKRERAAAEDVRLRREALALVASRLGPIDPPSGGKDDTGEAAGPGG
jgi:transcriptional regulator with XRE-family HTH domain